MPAPVRFINLGGRRGRLQETAINLPLFRESIGATLTSNSPPINSTSAGAMGSVLLPQGGGAINQHIVNFGGLIGAVNCWDGTGTPSPAWGTIPSQGATSGVGDTNWAGSSYTSNFAALDQRMQYAVQTGVAKRIITMYSAPFWMLGIDGGPIGYFDSGSTFHAGQWVNSSSTVESTSDPANPLPYFTSSSPQLANMRVQYKYHAAFGSLAAYIAQRYTGQVASSLDGSGAAGSYFAANPLTHMQVWNELKGYFGGIYNPANGTITYGANNYDWVDYIDLYNQIYTQVKAVAPSVKIGGPYAQWVFTPYSETYGPTEAGSVSATNGAPAQTITLPDAGITNTVWGTLDPRIVRGTAQWAMSCAGADFIAVDFSVGNYASQASPTPTEAQMQQRIGDIVTYINNNIAPLIPGSPPVIASEIYGFGTNNVNLPGLLTEFFAAGGDTFLIWHQQVGTAALIVGTGNTLTDAGPVINTYLAPAIA